MIMNLILIFLCLAIASALVPTSPNDQTRRAIASLRNAINGAKELKQPCRLYLDYLIPLPLETKAEDIDPWPGGLAQMYPYAETFLKEILQGISDSPNGPSS